ncbi:ammonium transporter [marine gamma proteobacterium HTCC2148]|jgi:Amt family ammonium transporter|uniref:Ammonium transporter n=1 Tax=Candidatus Seongchinamella marina TaxID=2518990 RepID=A0ABT3SXE5_9GAMM|nr:ammonium transporter [marine gamma proteobacterium HTCC2148]MBT6125318.1 ammonium transporter [Halieaceae bacterium]MCX2974554.1 ammonium transporter [Candidatus Seongchinamella marina]
MKSLQQMALLMLVGTASASASAQELNQADTAWVLTATALVLFMTIPGLSLFYGGLVRVKNVLSILMQCFALTCLMSLLWFAVGYTIAFGSDGVEQGAFIGDFGNVFFAAITMDSLNGGIPATLFAIFQMTFAIITPALIVGGFAERMRFSAMLLFSAIWLIVVYAPVCHWVWGGGWLGSMGLQDFAGGTVVHITAAVAALVAAMMMGPRRGFGKVAMPPHNLTLTVAGAGMLWVGWFGFNAGSAVAADNSAAMAMLVTHLSASAGALAWMAMEWIRHGKPSVLGIVTGMVAGLGTITPASGSVGPAAAVVIGLTAGVVCYFATNWIKNKLKIDDSLDVFPVHGVGGILGTLLAGVFCSTQLGVFSGNGFSDGIDSIGGQLMVQATGVVATFTYTAVATWVILKVVDLMVGLRVDADEETQGLDLVLHDERGYDL